MKRNRHSRGPSHQPKHSKKSPGPSSQGELKPLPNGRRWLFRLIIALGIPLVLLCTAEGFLRLAKFGHPTSFLVRKQIKGRAMLIDNPWFGLRFFPPGLARSPNPISIPAEKPAGTYRVFLFGESAAMGDPRPAYGVGRYLKTLLEERFPGTNFEVVSAAMTAINSHALLPIARECARYQGDLWIVYMGNNEFVGPFGANTVFGPQAPPAWAVRAYLALQETRLGQLLVGLARNLHKSRDTPANWGGLKMFLEHQLPPEDPRKERVYQNFKKNLADLLSVAGQAGVPVIVSSVASNLKDCAPFGSYLPPGLKGAPLADWQGNCEIAASRASQRKFNEAIAEYQKALQINPLSADVQFQLGECFLAISNLASARQSFVRARDLDALPVRADTRLNQIVQQSAKAQAGGRVFYVDAERVLGEADPSGIPGGECFYEHVHLNCEGNYRLALAFAESAAKCLPAEMTHRQQGPWADFTLCNQRLGLTDWNRLSIEEEILRRLSDPPFTGQLEHAAQMEQFTNQLVELRLKINRSAVQEARAVYEVALKLHPQDAYLHHNFAEFLTDQADLAGAAVQMQAVCDLLPENYMGWFQLGRIRARQKQLDNAQSCFETAVRLRPDVFEVHVELGQVLAAGKKVDEAMAEYELAQKLHGEDAPRVLVFQADLLARQHRQTEAEKLLEKAIQLQPDYSEAHELLGIELALETRYAEAQTQFEQVVRLRPNYVDGHLNLGIALARQRRFREALEHFTKTLQLDPTNAQAHQFVSSIQALQAQAITR